MTPTPATSPAPSVSAHPAFSSAPLCLWPGVILVLLQWVLRFVVPFLFPPALIFGVLSGLACGLGIIVWWLFFSRAPWIERIGALGVMVLAVIATLRVVHPSIAGGMMGLMLPFSAVPVLSLALVVAAVATRRRGPGLRRAMLIGGVVAACGVFTLLRTDGIMGDGGSDLHWRWTKTHEERLLVERADKESAARGAPTQTTKVAIEAAAWSGFRGPNRDGIVRGVRINPDWAKSPPVEIWRRAVGPGWSSFAVHDDVLYTQEQLGEDEVVTCYKLATGEPAWRHRDAVRFYESNAGAGPRATPTLSGGRIYTFGATGLLNALDASTGAVIWSRNVATDRHASVPTWGFASSPLVVDDTVVVAAGGKLVAYAAATGKPRWFGPAHGGGYSSPHQATIGGVPQVLLLSTAGATSVAPASGKVLWEHAWTGTTIVQPMMTPEGDVLISTGGPSGGLGTRRLAVVQRAGGWSVEERWTSRALKPYFNDCVVHKGHAFGFDGSVLACIDLKDGERKWKGGRYGNGQLVLLADQDLLLVLSEHGEVALVAATAGEFKELARFPAIKGKTWNHPVLAGDVLLVRNSEEMAAFRVSLAGL